MYTQPGSNSHATVHAHSGSMIFYTLLCFSLAGLIAGFAIGGFASHLSGSAATSVGSPHSSAPILAGQGPFSSATATPENTFLGVPKVGAGDYTSPERADDTTSYPFTAQIVNKADNTPITVTDVICRLWLTDDPQGTVSGLSDNNYALLRNPGAFNQPFPAEVEGALNFTSSSQQTQPCAANGKTKWNYTLANSVAHGSYDLVVLADWKGIHYNWYIVEVNVHNHDNGNSGNDNGNNTNSDNSNGNLMDNGLGG